MSKAKDKRSKAGVRIKLGKVDQLSITMHPGYVHLKLISPGRPHFIQEIYVPRRVLLPILRWLVKAQKQVELDPLVKGFYVPDAERAYLAAENLFEADQKQAKRKRDRKRRART